MEIMQASPFTVGVISFTLFFTVLYWFYLLPFEKAKLASFVTVLAGTLTLTLCLFNVIGRLAPFGGILILIFWLVPSLFIWKKREDFKGLNQRTLVGLQILRVIGGLFILEMFRGHIPASFALPAGIGDIFVGTIALILFLFFEKIPRLGISLVIFLGLADFAMAFTFGFLSLPGPFQQFAIGFDNQINLFPTGLIPIFLVPYAIAYHVLSIINLPERGLN